MAVIEGGVSAALAGVGVESSSPLHVASKPTPYGTLGHYAIQAETGTIAAGMGANGILFAARWTDASRFAVVYEIGVCMFRNITTGFAIGNWNFRLLFCRAWTADDTGGTTLTISGENNQLRTSMGASLFGAIRIAAAAALGAGTRTPDTQALNAIYGRVPVTIGVQIVPLSTVADLAAGPVIPLFSRDPASEHPIVLAQNEGIEIQGNVPATGTWNAAFYMKWAEVTAY